MTTESLVASEAPAHALAMIVAANGHIDERELRVLEELDAFRRLGISRRRFRELARNCLHEVGAGLCERSWLRVEELLYVDALLDAVVSRDDRLLVCRCAAAVIAADGRITADERRVYDHTLARWHITQEMVTQAILHDRAR